MDKKIIEKILESGNLAPSGGNSQPWRFIVRDDLVEVILMPEKDHKIFNFKGRGTQVAHGALIENMEIASRFYGYETITEILPARDISARIQFKKKNQYLPLDNELYNAIAIRHSNRKPFKKEPLETEKKDYLLGSHKLTSDCQLFLLEGGDIDDVSTSLGSDILIQLSNRKLHTLLYNEVIWNKHDQEKRGGLYIKTMEMFPPKSLVFGLLGNWNIAKIMNKIGFVNKIYQENSKKNATAGLIGIITAKNDDKSFINAGRLMENVWLRATKINLSIQLTSGILFLWQQVNFGNREIFSDSEIEIINRAYKNISEKIKTTDIVAIAFRIGVGEPPSATSYKRPPQIEWK